MKERYRYYLDGVEFELAEDTKIDLLRNLGQIISVFDQNDSGNISFVVRQSDELLFVKIAGYQTVNAKIDKEHAILNLKRAYGIYSEIVFDKLIAPIDFWEKEGHVGLVFPYVKGDCLLDHWNYDYYERNKLISPLNRFLGLSVEKKIKMVESLFEFYDIVSRAGYVATDFYEGSVLYDFLNDDYYFCDIDFFTPHNTRNENGEQWGPSRFLAPEEISVNGLLYEVTDVYHLGKFIAKIMCDCSNTWQLSKLKYDVVEKAIQKRQSQRYQSIKEFYQKWKSVE